jgi:hypothetical protein
MTGLVMLTGQVEICPGTGQNAIEEVITAETGMPAAFGPHRSSGTRPRRAKITETGRQICLADKSVSEAG